MISNLIVVISMLIGLYILYGEYKYVTNSSYAVAEITDYSGEWECDFESCEKYDYAISYKFMYDSGAFGRGNKEKERHYENIEQGLWEEFIDDGVPLIIQYYKGNDALVFRIYGNSNWFWGVFFFLIGSCIFSWKIYKVCIKLMSRDNLA